MFIDQLIKLIKFFILSTLYFLTYSNFSLPACRSPALRDEGRSAGQRLILLDLILNSLNLFLLKNYHYSPQDAIRKVSFLSIAAPKQSLFFKRHNSALTIKFLQG